LQTDLRALLKAATPEAARDLILSLPADAIRTLQHDWTGLWARPEQLRPPGDWILWLILAGRGWGKSRTGAECIRDWIEAGTCGRVALVARTAADARDVMVDGESGLLAISPPWFRPVYEPSKRRLTWPNGAIATTYTAEEPDALRGPQHDGAWCDEIASWKYPEDAYNNLLFGLRLGTNPRIVGTTTPKPTRHMRALIADATTAVTKGKTQENAPNLARTFLRQVVGKYLGTSLGRQELDAEMLEDVAGALWKRDVIDDLRRRLAPELRRVVVAIDPAVTNKAGSDETGIITVGLGSDGHAYVLEDLSGHYSPDGWGRRAVAAYDRRQADIIVAEVNNGGDMVGHTINTVRSNVHFKAVHASRGKRVRAEPVAALYEQGKVHHVGAFAELEDQLTTWDSSTGEESPDRLDALVWALTELMLLSSAPAEYDPSFDLFLPHSAM
jgi:phage terminase large subunit-like protein